MISVSGEERTALHAKYPAKIAETKTRMNLRGHIVGKNGEKFRNDGSFLGFLYTERFDFLEGDANSGKRQADDNKLKAGHSF